MTAQQLELTIEFFRKAGLNAREHEGCVYVTTDFGSTTAVIAEAMVICPFPTKAPTPYTD